MHNSIYRTRRASCTIGKNEALQEIEHRAETQFDPHIAKIFISLLHAGGNIFAQSNQPE